MAVPGQYAGQPEEAGCLDRSQGRRHGLGRHHHDACRRKASELRVHVDGAFDRPEAAGRLGGMVRLGTVGSCGMQRKRAPDGRRLQDQRRREFREDPFLAHPGRQMFDAKRGVCALLSLGVGLHRGAGREIGSRKRELTIPCTPRLRHRPGNPRRPLRGRGAALRAGEGGGRRRPLDPAGRVLRHARPLRLGQDDVPAPHRRLRAAGRRPYRNLRREGRRPAALPARGEYRVPGLRAVPASFGRRQCRLRSARPRRWPCRARQAGPRGPGNGEARRHGEPPPGTAFRRSAPARRARPRPHRASQGAAARRTVGRAGPQAARRDAARAEGPATRARPQLCLRHPRSGRSPVDGRPRRGVQRRPNRAGRPSGRSL